jgi:CelD/BcsL family acetyltransferase involved in cellulose biosynthesis
VSASPDFSAAGMLQVRLWTEEEFAGSQAIWDELLSASVADPLFMSWEWQWRWWQHHRDCLGAELQLVALYSGTRLVGLAPFYAHRAVVRRVLHPRRLELIGAAWRDSAAAFSDYLDILASRAWCRPVLAALLKWLRSAAWDELVLCCTKRGGTASEFAERHLPDLSRVREVDPLTGWCVDLPERFDEYLRRLTPEVRRRLFNQRRKLEGATVRYASEREVAADLEQLWRYVGDRWGSGGPGAELRGFYRDMALSLARDGRLRLSRLESRGETLSVMFNAVVGDTVYYLQSGFDRNRSAGLSPGYLHFGYAIERACEDGQRRFDFLGGTGRHRNYKRDLLTENVPLVTYHAVRGVWIRALYAAYDLWLKE